MKKNVSALVLVLLVGAGVGFSQGQGPDKPDPMKRVEAVEKDLEAQRQKCDALAADLEATKAQLKETLAYLDAQAKSASAMAATLDESERLGFTFGINPDSRHTLLRGWREQLTVAQQPVAPATPPTIEAPKPGAKKP